MPTVGLCGVHNIERGTVVETHGLQVLFDRDILVNYALRRKLQTVSK